MKSWNRLDWAIILIFAALVALFYWRILTPTAANRQSFPPGDFYNQFWAFSTFEVRELSAGRLPLWNPYTFAGAPFWADVQAAVLYPFSLFTILLSAPWGFSAFALEVEAVFHIWLAAALMYLFARDVTRSRAAGAVAALSWAFGGYLTGYPSQQLAVLEVDVWLPLILFFIYHASRQPAAGFFGPATFMLILAGVAWGIALLAGHPQSYLIVGYISAAYLLFLWWSAAPQRQFKSRIFFILAPLPPLLIFLLTGLALAAIQFIPATEYTLLSVRAAGNYPKMSGGFPLVDLVQLLLPGQISFYSPLYVGVVGLLLAGLAITTRPNRHVIFWSGAAALALLISLGGHTFLYSPLYLAAPGFSIFRGQERWAAAVAFSLALLAGYGFSQLTANADQLAINAARLARATGYLFLFALLLVLAFFFGLNNTGWTPASPFYGLLGAATLLTILAALVWLLWQFAPRLPAPLFAVFTAAVICFNLFSVNWQTNLYPQPPEWHTPQPAAVQAIAADAAQSPAEPYRVYNEFRLYDNYGVPFKQEDLWGASPLRPDRYDKFLAPPMPIERAWALLNVKYVITWREKLYAPSTVIYQEPAADGVTYVHRLNSVGARVWLVDQTEIATDDAILQKLANANFDYRRLALLEPGNEAYNLQPATGESANNSQFAIRSSQFLAPGHLVYQISTPAPALLILSEPYFPGWQATVNGQPAPILRADYILRAVPVPAGDSAVELNFHPASFTVGAIISGAALVGIVLVLLLSFYRRTKN